MKLAFTVFLIACVAFIPFWEMRCWRRRRATLHRAKKVPKMSECFFSTSIQYSDQLPELACKLPEQQERIRIHKDRCFQGCERSVHRSLLEGTTLNLADASSLYSEDGNTARIVVTTVAAAIPAIVAIQKIWS